MHPTDLVVQLFVWNLFIAGGVRGVLILATIEPWLCTIMKQLRCRNGSTKVLNVCYCTVAQLNMLS